MLRMVIWFGFIALLASGQSAQAHPEEGSNYVRGDAGYIFPFDSFHEQVSQDTGEGDVEFKGGITGAVALGRYFKPNWRAEGEVSILHNKVDTSFYTPTSPPATDGYLRAYTFMANLYRDFPLNSKMRAYVGGGIGGVLIDPNYTIDTQIGPLSESGNDLNFGAQGLAGVDYDLSKRLSMGLRYRYLWAGKYDFASMRAEYANHAILAGLTYRWGPKAQPEPPAPPPPPPPPPPPAEPNELLDEVLFPHDSYEITAASAEKLDEVARIIRERKITAIRLEGHTDTSGSVEYNQRLSQNRAVAVRDALIDRGVPADNVAISAKGELDPRVPTGDNVRNQANRWVRIFVRYD